jgi:hypothetical protein
MLLITESPGHYWAEPARRIEGDSGPDAIYLAVGKALTQWESLENDFAQLFGLLVANRARGGATRFAAQRAYGVIASAGGRREALEAAGEVFFTFLGATEEERLDFDLLLKHLPLATTKRNYIAHGIVLKATFPISALLAGNNPGGYFIEPPEYNSNKRGALKGELFPGTTMSMGRVN